MDNSIVGKLLTSADTDNEHIKQGPEQDSVPDSSGSVADDSENNEISSENEEPSEEVDSKKDAKKRTRKEDNWNGKVRKRFRNQGKATNKNQVAAKTFEHKNCYCSKQCFERVLEDERRAAFDDFWEIGAFSEQNAYLCSLVERIGVQQRKVRDPSRPVKECSYKYYLNISGQNLPVCKQYFLQTFAVSDGRLSRCLKKEIMGKPAGTDNRGKKPPANKTPIEIETFVKNHILSFPNFQNPYNDQDEPDRKYLSERLNIRLMYKMYLEQCQENNRIAASEHVYRRLFHAENLHFLTPIKEFKT